MRLSKADLLGSIIMFIALCVFIYSFIKESRFFNIAFIAIVFVYFIKLFVKQKHKNRNS